MKLAATLIGLSFATLGAAQAALCEVSSPLLLFFLKAL